MEDLSPPWDDLPPEYTLRASDALGEFSLDSGPRLRRVQGSPSRNALSSREQLDDGKPTADPTPGHPLLKDGKVLVYPKGFECRKCLNKGFKPHLVFGLSFMASAFAPGDPQSPCKGCWEKYARPYTRLLEEMDWENRPTDANYQRPISRAGNHVNLNVGANFRPKYYENSAPVFNSRVEFETPNDGKPTVSPCPGHPLLMSGHVLIYPIGFKCDKCFNRGFKPSDELFNFQSNTYSFGPADPYNPCKSCWRSFGRHYTEELQQKDWLDPRNTTYQRPIRPSRSEGPSGSQPEASGHRLEDPSTDDGKPTSRPLPGHPLLRDGMVLIYPRGHRCDQCYNKGYTSGQTRIGSTVSALAPGDPKHPCTTCWDKYSREYTDELTAIDWTNDTSGTLQKPIYRFAPRFN